jgi:hypothetical protein
MTQYKLVKVQWLDSASSYGWVNLSDIKEEDLVVNSIGYLVHETDKSITLSCHIGATCVDAPMCIPRIAIIKMEEA